MYVECRFIWEFQIVNGNRFVYFLLLFFSLLFAHFNQHRNFEEVFFFVVAVAVGLVACFAINLNICGIFALQCLFQMDWDDSLSHFWCSVLFGEGRGLCWFTVFGIVYDEFHGNDSFGMKEWIQRLFDVLICWFCIVCGCDLWAQTFRCKLRLLFLLFARKQWRKNE